MPPPTREQVNALIKRLTGCIFTMNDEREVLLTLTALQAENDRLRAQASPAWVATKDRAAIAGSTPVGGYVIGGSWRCGQWNVSSAFEKGRLSSIDEDRTHFLIIPAPPEIAEDRQRREDEEAAQKYIDDATCCFSVGEARRAFVAGRESARKEATP